jgi:hypothetical protein
MPAIGTQNWWRVERVGAELKSLFPQATAQLTVGSQGRR